MAESVPQETQPLVSPEIKLGENASILHRQADAVFDGVNLTLGWVACDEKEQTVTDAQKQKQKQEALAQKLNSLKEGDKPILGREITADEIAQLSTEVQKLFGPDGKFAGIYANFLGDPQKNPEASSLAMVAFLDYLRANTETIKQGKITADQLLQGAYEQVVKVLKAAGVDEKDFPSLAVALVGKDGQVFALNSGGQEIVIIGADGKARKIGETKDSDGKITVDSSQKIDKEEKIILCSKKVVGNLDKILQQDKSKTISQIVKELTSPTEEVIEIQGIDPNINAGLFLSDVLEGSLRISPDQELNKIIKYKLRRAKYSSQDPDLPKEEDRDEFNTFFLQAWKDGVKRGVNLPIGCITEGGLRRVVYYDTSENKLKIIRFGQKPGGVSGEMTQIIEELKPDEIANLNLFNVLIQDSEAKQELISLINRLPEETKSKLLSKFEERKIVPAESATGGKMEGAAVREKEQGKKTTQVTFEPQPQAPGDRRFIFPRYEDTAKTINAEEFMKLYPEHVEVAQRIFEKVKSKIPRNSGEKEEEWQIRVWEEIKKRLSLPGFYSKKDDEIYSMLITDPELIVPLKDSHFILMATEALQIQLKKQINQQYEARHKTDLERLFRRDVKTVVSHVGEPAYIEGDFDHYFNEQGKIKEGPAKDLLAFTLVADRLLDVPFETDSSGKEITYRERMRQLIAICKDSQKSQEERDQANRQLVALRSSFYSLAIEAIRTRNQPQFINPNPEERQGREKILGVMYAKLQEVSKMNIDQLIDHYQGVEIGISERNKTRIRNLLTNELPYLFDYALKGGDLMQRRISYELKLPYEIDDNIHYKQLIQGPTSLEELATGRKPPELHSVSQTPQTAEADFIQSLRPGTGEVPPGPPAAPTGERRDGNRGESSVEKRGENLPVAPVGEGDGKKDGERQEQGSEPIPTEVPTKLVFAAFSEDQHALQQAHDLAFATAANYEQVFRNRGLLPGKLSYLDLLDRSADFLSSLGGRLRQKGIGGKIAAIPLNVLSGALRLIRHPIKQGWRSLFKNSFDNLNFRFAAEVQGVVREAAGISGNIPFDVSVDIINLALQKGSERRNKGFFRKVGNNIRDLFSDLSIIGGGFYTSEQKEALEWLKEELKKPPAERDSNLRALLGENFTSQVIEEQDAEGRRFAYLGEGIQNLDDLANRGLSLEQVNRAVLAQAGRETRVALADVSSDLARLANQRIKSILTENNWLERYALALSQGDAGKEQRIVLEREILEKLTSYLKGEFYQALPEEYKKNFEGWQIASNIIDLARKIAPHWSEQGYLRKDSDGKTLWEKVEFQILIGKGAWHGRRGEHTYGKIGGLFGWQERVHRRLVERSLGIFDGKTYERGVTTALAFKDFLSYWGVGMIGSLLQSVPGTLARGGFSALSALSLPVLPASLGGAFGVAGLSAIRERGFEIGSLRYKGHLEKELERISREVALRRKGEQGAYLRSELEQALVKTRSASELTESIRRLISDNEPLTPEKAKMLLAVLAEADARVRLSDFSGRREMKFRTQNFISYTEGKEGEENLSLHSALLDGQMRLMDYLLNHPQEAAQIIPGHSITNASEFCQVFEKISGLAEAQLRFGSEPKAAKRLREFLLKERQRFGLHDETEVDRLVNEVFPNLNLQIKADESLERKERIWQQIRNIRSLEVGLTVMAASPVMGGVSKVFIGEAQNLASDIQEAGGILHFGTGFNEWMQEWNQVLHGDVPIEIVGGHPVADLSPLQKGALLVRNIIEPPVGLPHTTVIDGVNFTLDGNLRYTNNGTNDYLVDIRNGEVYDLTDFKLEVVGGNLKVFATVDLNGDGVIDFNDHLLAEAQFNQIMDKAGIQISAGPDIITSSTVDVLKPSDLKPVNIDGYEVMIPQGTHFQLDPTSGKYDLVLDSDPNHVLINDVSFDAQGHMTYASIDPALSLREIPGSKVEVTGAEALSEWQKYTSQIDHREWYSYNQEGSQGNELRLYVRHEGDDIVIDMSKMREGYQTGVTPEHVNVEEVISSGKAVLAWSLPGHTKEPILVQVPTDGQLRLNFNDTTHYINILNADGTLKEQMTVADFTRMMINPQVAEGLPQGNIVTELGHQDLFNLGLDGKMGYIEAGRIDPDTPGVFQAFATIRGASPVTAIIGQGVKSVIEVTDTIRQTIVSTTPSFLMESSSIDFSKYISSTPFLAIPTRDSVERSVRGDSTKTTPPTSTQPQGTPPSSQSQPTSTTPSATLTSEQRQKLEQRREELLQRKKRIEEAIESAKKNAPGGKPIPEQEQELARINQELAQIETQLNLHSQETQPGSLTKEEYEELKRKILKIFEGEPGKAPNDDELAQINFYLTSTGLSPLENVSQLNDLRNDKQRLNSTVTQVVRQICENSVIIKKYEEEFRQILSAVEDETLKDENSRKIVEEWRRLNRELNKIEEELESASLNEEDRSKKQQEKEEVERRLEAVGQQAIPLITGMRRKALEKLYEAYKDEINEEIKRVRQQIERWERAEKVITSPERRNPFHPKEIKGHSEKGTRDKDEDAYFDGDFHFGESTVDIDLLKQIGVLETNESLAALKDKLEQSGLSVSIVADGMGGHGNGEIASAIAVVGLIKQLTQLREVTEKSLKEAIMAVNEYIYNYNKTNNSDSGTTLVAQITDKNGNTWVVSVGDSRVYQINDKNECRLLTCDQSLVWALMVSDQIGPEQIFIHPNRNQILGVLDGKLDETKIQVYNLGSQPSGSRLVLCCDGVWEGVDPTKIPDELITQFNERVKKLKQEGKQEGDAREIAAQEFFGQVFFQVILGGDLNNLNPRFLTREEITNLSGDNATAVVVKF